MTESMLPYFGVMLLAGMALGTLRAFGADWLPLIIAGVALHLATILTWWQRHGKRERH